MAPVGTFEQRLDAAAATVAATPTPAEVDAIIADWVPELATALHADAERGAFAGWGLSTVLDENAGEVVGRPLFDWLHSEAGLEAEWPIGNAGLLHVYGYLLSAVDTPFGLKRERWLRDDLSAALGTPNLVHPPTPAGLVHVITAVLHPLLADPAAHSGVLVVIDEFAPDEREDVARAVLVGNPAGGDANVVVYGLLIGSTVRIVTAFPTGIDVDTWVRQFTARSPRLRFNAAAHELPPRSRLAGRRVTLSRTERRADRGATPN